MRYEELPVFELAVVFAAEPARASRIHELVALLVCRQTGGHGEGEAHVCGGFHCSCLRDVPGGMLE